VYQKELRWKPEGLATFCITADTRTAYLSELNTEVSSVSKAVISALKVSRT